MTDDRDENIDVIRKDIEDTRQRISTEIDAIEGKLTPDYARHVAKERLVDTMGETRDRVASRIDETRHMVADRIGGTAAIVRSNAMRIGTDFGASVRANPIPLALIGVGTGWILWQTFRPAKSDIEMDVEPLFELEVDSDVEGFAGVDDTSSLEARGFVEERELGVGSERGAMVPTDGESVRRAGREVSERAKSTAREAKGRASSLAREAKGRASRIAGEAKGRASQIAQRSKERSRDLANRSRERSRVLAQRSKERAVQARDASSEAFDANPIAFGALALLAGIGLGLALPHTMREDRMLGEKRQQLAQRARRIADEARHVAVDSLKEGARVAQETAKHEASERHLVP